MESLLTLDVLIALLTLTTLEIVLGVDNLVFVSILTAKLPREQQPLARRIGLGLAMIMRIGLLFALTWITRLTTPLFEVFHEEISGRDILLLLGGLFLLGKSVTEINERMEAHHPEPGSGTVGQQVRATFLSVIVQIVLLDLVFSLDSVLTAVGLSNQIPIMAIAIIVAVFVMMFSVGPITGFIESHPTVTILALSFLLLIGMSLIAEALEFHIPKGYIYFAMGFSIFVEVLNLRVRGRAKVPAQH